MNTECFVSPQRFRDYFGCLVGQRLSVLLDLNRDETYKESYVGTLEVNGIDFIVLQTERRIKRLIVRKSLIQSVWVY
jgi:hypothetical protein